MKMPLLSVFQTGTLRSWTKLTWSSKCNTIYRLHGWQALLLLYCLTLLPTTAWGEIQTFTMLLFPDESVIHYSDGYIRGPGMIDLSQLTFTAISEAFVGMDDDGGAKGQDATGADDDTGINGDDSGNDDLGDDIVPNQGGGGDGTGDASGGGGGGGRQRRQQQQQEQQQQHQLEWVRQQTSNQSLHQHQQRSRMLDGALDTKVDGTMVDIAVFPLPEECSNSRSGCDWTDLGVGAKTDSGDKRWCCSDEAVDLGLCDGSSQNYGRLILNESFGTHGQHRFVQIPSTGDVTKQIRYGTMENLDSGTWVVVFANCNPQGREIKVTGNSIWKSAHGYLPGELFGFMYFYACVTLIYFALLAWFGLLMYYNEESRIPIEKWILVTIILGLLEMLFRSCDYFVWNEDGYRQYFIGYVGLVAGVLKQGISRCLIVMVALGWGVIRDSLGSTLTSIVVLGTIYTAVSAARDLMVVFAIQDIQTLSYNNEVRLFDLATVLTFIIAAIDVVFIMWILDALNNTMEYLEMNNQTRKLMRYLRLRTLFLFSILFATIWAVFSLVDTYDDEGIVREEHEWIVDAATEVNYLFVLIGVAIMWRPNPNAKEYAYVMELPALGGGEGEHELELTGVVPSAMDDDDDNRAPASGPNGYHDESERDDRFQIDDAEPA